MDRPNIDSHEMFRYLNEIKAQQERSRKPWDYFYHKWLMENDREKRKIWKRKLAQQEEQENHIFDIREKELAQIEIRIKNKKF